VQGTILALALDVQAALRTSDGGCTRLAVTPIVAHCNEEKQDKDEQRLNVLQ